MERDWKERRLEYGEHKHGGIIPEFAATLTLTRARDVYYQLKLFQVRIKEKKESF